MDNVLELINNYFIFLGEFTRVYKEYCHDANEYYSEQVRYYSKMNNDRVDEIHCAIDSLSQDEISNLQNQISSIIYALKEEKNIINIEIRKFDLEKNNTKEYNYYCDKISDIDHKIYCYIRIVIDYIKQKDYKKGPLSK